MDLYGNESLLFDGVIDFCVINGFQVIDPQLNTFSFASDAIGIPVFLLQHFGDVFLLR